MSNERQQPTVTAEDLNRQLAAEMAAERDKHGEGNATEAGIPVVEIVDQPATVENQNITEEMVDAVPFPPGPVGEFAEVIMPMCRFAYRPFATLGALIGYATVVARKIRFENLYPSLYGFALAISSNGKEDVQRVVEEALHYAGVDQGHLGSRITSYNAAIEQLMGVWYHPVLFAGVDEGAGFLDAARKGEYGLKDFLKEVWSKCGRWQYPWRRKKNSGNVTLQPIYHPALNIYLGAQPESMGAVSDFAEIQDGLLPRCIWVVREKWEKIPNFDAPKHADDLKSTMAGKNVIANMRKLWDWTRPKGIYLSQKRKNFCDMEEVREYYQSECKGVVGDGEKEGIWPQPVPYDAPPEVHDLFRTFELECREKGAPGRGKQALLNGLWGKATENAKRIALTLAAARCGPKKDGNMIQLEEAEWAMRFIRASVFSGIRWGRAHLFESRFQALCSRVYDVIAEAGEGIKQMDLTVKLQHRCAAKETREALETLEMEGRIERISIATKGRTADGWRLVDKRK